VVALPANGAAWLRAHRMLVGLVVGLPISALFLWLAARNANMSSVRNSLEDARLGLVALAVVAMLAVYGFQAVRWRTIARTSTVSPSRFYQLVVSGVACNNVLPGRLGDLLRARWLGLEARMPAGRALGTVVLDRGCDVVALFAFLAVGLFAVASADWLDRIAILTTVGLAVLGALLVFARQYTNRRSRERRQRGLVRRVLRDAAELLAEPLGRRPVAWFALSLAAWATWALAAILVARSVGIELDVTEALFVAAIMNLGVAIPSSPGFVGTYQWLGVASLGLLGFGADEALAFAILLHASWYVPTTLLGGVVLAVRAIRSRRPARSGDATANEGA
jgi:glycosyltransferase 2 family protein